MVGCNSSLILALSFYGEKSLNESRTLKKSRVFKNRACRVTEYQQYSLHLDMGWKLHVKILIPVDC